MQVPRLVIAGATSGVGKTIITTAILYACKKKGMKVQPFKIGPDFIDPTYHTLVTQRVSRNLDMWMMGKKNILKCVDDSTQDCDIVIIEGVMGLFDGLSGKSEFASTAHVAKLLNASIILVIDASKAARSIAAIALGFLHFDRNLKIAGIVLNNIAGSRHANYVSDAFAQRIKAPIIGIVKRDQKMKFKERHLGLIPSSEMDYKEKKSILECANIVSDQLNLDKLNIIRKSLDTKTSRGSIDKNTIPTSSTKIAVALDESFNFYYQDNLDALRKEKVELVFFSPVNDSMLPSNIDGIMLGGGFPEILSEQLERNCSMKKSIAKAANNGMPIYGECGGLMYLSKSVRGYDKGKKKIRKMVGIIEADTYMDRKLTLNYTLAECNSSILGTIFKLRGHEFHYSAIENIPKDSRFAFSLKRGNGIIDKKDGFVINNLLASYMHLHFSDKRIPKRLAESFLKYSRR